MLDESNAGQILNQIVKRCIKFTNLSFDNLYVADRDYLIFYIRSGSFVAADNAFKFKIEKCDNCSQPATFDIKLSDLQLDEISSFSVQTKVFDKTVTIRPPKMHDPVYKLKDLELSRMLNYSNLVDIFGSVELACATVLQLDAYSYVRLVELVNKMKCGIQEELPVMCPHCSHPINLKWHFDEQDLLGKIDIRNLLRSILSISKYTNYQVTDDLLYSEYQLIEQITAKMISEENKAYEQANGMTTLSNR